MIRKPIVSDVFYPSHPQRLEETIQGLFTHHLGPGAVPKRLNQPLTKSFGLILPHAGYIYSGPVAAWGLFEIMRYGTPKTVILLGPSHTGMGKPVSVWDKGSWRTPFGEVPVNTALAEKILDAYDYAKRDFDAHINEHSLEVQLPLLQFCFGSGFSILPITMMDQRKNTARELGAVFHTIAQEEPMLIVASSDLNHYEPHSLTTEKDEEVIQAVLNKDIDGLYSAITEDQISMCGFGPVATLVAAGLGQPRLLKHASSGDTGGDFSHVVGYASMIIEPKLEV